MSASWDDSADRTRRPQRPSGPRRAWPRTCCTCRTGLSLARIGTVAVVLLLAAAAVRAQPDEPPPARPMPTEPAAIRQSRLTAETLGQLALLLRSYAQIGLQVRAESAADRLAQTRVTLDQAISRVRRGAGRALPSSDARRLDQRWRSIRDATLTRPAADIAGLMDGIADDLSSQLHAMIATADGSGSARDPRLARSWQRQNLQQIAKTALLACWQSDASRLDRLDGWRRPIDAWLRSQEKHLSPVAWVQFNAQWNLLTTSLPRAGSGCTPSSLHSIVASADRLDDLIAAQP